MKALQLTVAPREGALVRVLGLVERRGYAPVRVDFSSGEGGDYQLSLGVMGSRPVELLARQLSRLIEVKRVEVCS